MDGIKRIGYWLLDGLTNVFLDEDLINTDKNKPAQKAGFLF